MDRELEHSAKAAHKEYAEEPMKDFYTNTIAGYPSRLRVKKVLEELGDVKGKKVLDIGCEAGYVAFKILEKQPSHLYAIDIIDEAIEEFTSQLARKNYQSEVIVKKAFLQNMPFPDEMIDSIVCTEVIEHAPNIDQGFSEMARVLKKGGKLILTFPNEPLRKKVYPLVKLFGINTDIEKEVTLFEYDPNDIMNKLHKHFSITKFYRLPRLFPITNVMICEKQ